MLLTGLGITLVLVISLWLRGYYIWVNPLDYDEGHWLMFGMLANAGFQPYTEAFVGIPPLALWFIQWGANLFGVTLAVRYPMMLLSLLGIGGIFWSFQPSRDWTSLLAGLLGAIFLSFNEYYFHDSATIMAEVPAVALSILSLILAYQYYVQQKTLWLVLSGMVFALSLALKVFVVFLPILIGMLILLTVLTLPNRMAASTLRRLTTATGLWLGGFLFPLAIFLIIYDPQALYHQVFTFRMALRQVWMPRITLLDNVILVSQMWLKLIPLVLGTLLGVLFGWQKHRLQICLWLTWLGLATVLLIWHIPLRDRYIVMLVPPLAALSAIGIANSSRWLFDRLGHHQTRYFSGIVTAVLVSGFVAYVLFVPIKSVLQPPSPDTFPNLNLEAIQYIWENSLSDDCIIADDQRWVLAADRLVPATLSETSRARLETGWLTVDEIVNRIETNDCPLVVYTSEGLFDEFLPQLRLRLGELYFLEIPFDKQVRLYLARKSVARKPAIPLETRMGDAFLLKGVDLTPMPWHPGQDVELATYWTTLTSPDSAYKIFLQLRNDHNEVVASFDHFPFPALTGQHTPVLNIQADQYRAEDVVVYPSKGMLPTNVWPVGNTIREVTVLNLPPQLPSGSYTLYLGLYNPDTLTRLAVHNKEENNELLLAPIKISN